MAESRIGINREQAAEILKGELRCIAEAKDRTTSEYRTAIEALESEAAEVWAELQDFEQVEGEQRG